MCGCVSVDLQSFFNPELKERIIEADSRWSGNKILIMDLSGQIASNAYDGLFPNNNSSPEMAKAIFNKAKTDPEIKAVILRIDSPGGEVTATDMIYHEILDFKQRTGVPIITSIMGLGCSGAYYLACATDKIYAHPTSITGSIGIIARFPKLTGLAKKIGYDEEIFTTGALKSMGHPLKEMTSDTRSVVQNSINELFGRFLNVVLTSRPGYQTLDEVKTVADGRIFTANQALDLKLIDEIDYLPNIIRKLKISLGLKKIKVVSYNTGGNKDLNIYSRTENHIPTQSNRFNINLEPLISGNRMGFHYLWLPGKAAL